ncbi:hypothetical protein [Rhodophyticola porphyridii]|nr:hypothetical protein [Rhodophyticola porphyridii]
MAQKLGEKVGQIDIHKKPKSTFGETLVGIALAIFAIFVLVNVFG